MLSEKPWNLERLVHVVMGVLFCAAFFILAQAAVQHYAGKDKFVEGSFWYVLFGSLCIHGAILIGTSIFLWWHRFGWSETFGFSAHSMPRAILLGVAAAVIFLPVGITLQNISVQLLSRVHIPNLPQTAVVEFDKADSWISVAYLIFFATILAPVAEEILFRGIIYAAVKQFGFPRLALWGSAFFFAAIHGNAPIFVPLLVLGLALAWLYDKTDNLLTSIIAHSVFNGLELVMMFYINHVNHSFKQLVPH